MIRIENYTPGTTTLDFGSVDVFAVNPTGGRRPVIHVLTWDTEADDVPPLLDALPDEQPVYVISPPFAEDVYDYPRTVGRWVDHVSSRTAALELPDHVAYVGWSFGGVVAVELAQAHHDRLGPGSMPIEVLMIDSQNPTWISDRTKATSKLHAATRLLAETAERPRADRVAFIRSRISDFRGDKDTGETRDEMSPLRRAILVSWFKYEPRKYSVSGTLLWCDDSRARVDDPALGWTRWWDGPFHIERLGRAHFEAYGEHARNRVVEAITELGSSHRRTLDV